MTELPSDKVLVVFRFNEHFVREVEESYVVLNFFDLQGTKIPCEDHRGMCPIPADVVFQATLNLYEISNSKHSKLAPACRSRYRMSCHAK